MNEKPMNPRPVKKAILAIAILAILAPVSVFSQAKIKSVLTLEEVIDIAKDQSPDAYNAKHTFRASYWQYRTYVAMFLPSVKLQGTLPNFSKRYENVPIVDANGNLTYEPSLRFTNTISGDLSINQNLPFTGGVFSISSQANRVDMFKDKLSNKTSSIYTTVPVNIAFRQSIFGLNTMKWDKRIEPLKYEEAKRKLLVDMEAVSIKSIRLFFELAQAQQNLAIAKFNYSNNDTLFKIAQGRFNIGTIGEDEMLQSELNFMNASLSVNEAELTLENSKIRLASFLGFNEMVDIELLTPNDVPRVEVREADVFALAKQNNPDFLNFQRQLIEAERSVAQARANRGFQADLNLTYGLNQQGDDFSSSTRNLRETQGVMLGITIPILDWGKGKGAVKMAQSQQEIVRNNVDQKIIDFDQNIMLKIRQYAQQEAQLQIATRTDTIAQRRYDVAKIRYLIGKVTITDMNNAEVDRNKSRQGFVNKLRDYWLYYYELRQLTLFDLVKNKPLQVNYDAIVK